METRPSPAPPAPRARLLEVLAQASAAAGPLLVAFGALVWNDGLPGARGGWRLRTFCDPEHGERAVAAHALARLSEFAAERAPARPIVFVGSSSIERFPLAELFPEKPCVNRGIADASARMLASLVPRLLERLDPAAIVVYAGVVDWRRSRGDVAATLAAVEALLRALRGRAAAPLLLLGPLPERDLDLPGVAALARLEAAIETRIAAARPGDPFSAVRWLPLARAPLVASGGALDPGITEDGLHLDREGYRRLALRIQEHGGDVGEGLRP